MPPVDLAYYTLLEVAPTFEEADLRKAYKKKALQLHPDKGGDPEEFRKMKAAYDVLSDPRKRKIYDQYGQEGLQLAEGNVANPGAMMVVLTRSGKASMIAIVSGFSLAVLSPVVLFALRWDDLVSYPWAISFIPMWIFQFLGLVFTIAFMRVPPPSPQEQAEWDDDMSQMHKEKRRMARNNRWSGSVVILLLISFEVFLALRLEGTVDWSWYIVALPLILLESILGCMAVSTARAKWVQMMVITAALQVQKPPPFFCVALQVVAWRLLRIIAYFMASAKADGEISASWYVCLIPVFVGSFMKITLSCLEKCLYDARQRHRREMGIPPEAGPQEERGMGVSGACCVVGFWLFMACFGASRLDGTWYSSFVILLPLFIFIVCCMCCFPTFLVAVADNRQEVPSDIGQPRAGGPGGPAGSGMGPTTMGASDAERAAAEQAAAEVIFEAAFQAATAQAMAESAAMAEGAAATGTESPPTVVDAPTRERDSPPTSADAPKLVGVPSSP